MKYDILNSPVKEADFLCLNTPLVCEREHIVFLTGRRGRGFLLEDVMRNELGQFTEERKTPKSWGFQKGHTGFRKKKVVERLESAKKLIGG